MLHPPQCNRSVLVSTHLLEQTVSPCWHTILQTPLTQDCPARQRFPQVPQLFGSVLVLAQLPSLHKVGVLVGQMVLHTPLIHWLLPVQALLQRPQCDRLALVLTHTPLQRERPVPHTHWLLLQKVPPLQAFPHPPQCRLLFLVSTQPPLQTVGVLAGQEVTQVLLEQICPLAHTVPHWPQFKRSDFVSTHRPLHTLCPEGQTQAPLTQDFPPPHVVPHCPQFLLLVCVLTHPPLQTTGVEGGQETLQEPLEQTSPFLHDFPHWPQCNRLVDRS